MRDTQDVMPLIIGRFVELQMAGFRAQDVFDAIADILDEEIDSPHYEEPRQQLVKIAALAVYGLRQGEEERP